MAAKKPNIVFVLTDDQGYGDLGCHGNPYIKTPNIDILYSKSVRLTDFHVGPTCSPTRAGLLTGHYANSTGVWHTVAGRSILREDENTIANFFSEAGYFTGLFGKWHLGDNYPYRPQDKGFQKVVTFGGGGIGNTPDYWGNNYNDDFYCEDGEWKEFNGYCTDVWFNEAVKFIEQHKAEPFFCYIPTNAPHLPHIVDNKYSSYYRELAQSDEKIAAFFNYPEDENMINFYGMVTCIDENVGILRRKLEDMGLSDNTVFIFMTDNGSAGGLVCDKDRFVIHGYNAGMRGEKATPFDGGHRVPFFINWPDGGIEGGRDVDVLTANIDILPTLMELCGAGNTEDYDFHGKSLVPLIKDGNQNWKDRAIVTDSQRVANPIKWRLSCVMRNKWRLVNGRMLYNIKEDPEQKNDISNKYLPVVKQLRDDYEEWWKTVSEKFKEEIPIPISTDFEKPVVFTCHDWRNIPEKEVSIEDYGGNTTALSNQSHVRKGIENTGYWEINVLKEGTYIIELRRWPREADLAMTARIPGEIKDYTNIGDGYGGGRAIPIGKARLKVGGFDEEKEVIKTDTSISFEVNLRRGNLHLETFLTNRDGLAMSAYYVYVFPVVLNKKL